MRKLVAVMLTILSCGAAYALPLGNPSEASLMCDGLFYEGLCADYCDPCVSWCDAWSFRAGFYGDYVFERHLEVDQGLTDGRQIEHSEIFTNAGYVAFNFYDRFDIFATFGATNINLETNAVAFVGTVRDRFKLETDTDFSWSIGARGTIYECECFSFGIEGQYFYTRPDISYVDVAYTNAVYPSSEHLKYKEWQIGIGVSYRIWNFVPYFGAKYSNVDVDLSGTTLSNTTTLNDLENRFNGGYVLGVSIVDCEKASLTVEARYPDETALYVNGQIRF